MALDAKKIGIIHGAPIPEVLYHGTGIYCLASIVYDDLLMEGCYWGKFEEPHGPRLTADFDVAATFIDYNLYEGEGGILAFDSALITSPIVAYQDSGYDGSPYAGEQEFAVVVPQLASVSRQLKSIICSPEAIEKGCRRDSMECARNEGGWPFGDGPGCFERAQAALRALAAHPKLNAWIPSGCVPPVPCDDENFTSMGQASEAYRPATPRM